MPLSRSTTSAAEPGRGACVEAQHRHHQIGERARHVGTSASGGCGRCFQRSRSSRISRAGYALRLVSRKYARSRRARTGRSAHRAAGSRPLRAERKAACRRFASADPSRTSVAEVDQLGVTVRRAPQVARADVAVHQTPRMDQRERGGGVAQQLAHRRHREPRPSALARGRPSSSSIV